MARARGTRRGSRGAQELAVLKAFAVTSLLDRHNVRPG
jgi:hypothetical protein